MVKVELAARAFSTSWGVMASLWSPQGLWELGFPRKTEKEAWADLRFSPTAAPESQAEDMAELAWEALAAQLQTYFQGFPVIFDVPLDWRGYTPFREKALRYVASVPYGCVCSYGEVSRAIGVPQGARAVGGAMHANRIPIVVPCHRVVAFGGKLGGFGGGLELKEALLFLERNIDN